MSELALAKRHIRQEETLREHTKTLPILKVLDTVMVQNQTAPHPTKWDNIKAEMECQINILLKTRLSWPVSMIGPYLNLRNCSIK